MKNIPGNYYDKYHAKNPIAQYLMNGFFHSLEDILSAIKFNSVLDAGCGEGEVTNYISRTFQQVRTIDGIELEDVIVAEANKRYPELRISQGSVYNIPFSENEFDLVVCSEVMEHLEDPVKAINEVIRVSSRYILISVPREPIWRICNMLRFKYINDFGNTPGHINHWSKNSFMDLLKSQNLSIVKINTPFPWIMALLEVNK